MSAITFSTAGLFTKGVEAESWDVIFWRGIFAATLTTVWTINRGTLRQNFFGMGYGGLAIAVVGALRTAAFIPSFKLTAIANVSLNYVVSPLIALSPRYSPGLSLEKKCHQELWQDVLARFWVLR
jgi:hypothetical protein